jgi:group II intron reverse transcriptase/maturase
MATSESQILTETKLRRIKWLSSQDKGKEFNNLMHLFNEESLEECYHELDGRKAIGLDKVTKDEYGENLQCNIKELVAKLKRMSYKPGDLREVKIPKDGSNGKMRTLGISNFEDKIIQKMTQKVLTSIYEPVFLESSFGFREGLGCHDAIRALENHLMENEVETVIDIDLANFFGTIDRKILLEILKDKIGDKKFLRYIVRMFKAGILADGELRVSEEGVVQGSIASPILSNIFAHVVIDEWFEEVVKKHCKGTISLFRYCDDAVICCRYRSDAERVRTALSKRLEKYNLKLNEDKTKIVNFSKSREFSGIKQESFNYLGFTFYLGRSRKGNVIPKLKSCGKRIREKLKKVKEWCKANKDKYKLPVLWEAFCNKIRGHIQYYGVTFNWKAVSNFVYRAQEIIFKWLNRRSQRKSFDWGKFNKFVKINPLPVIKIYHKLFVSE